MMDKGIFCAKTRIYFWVDFSLLFLVCLGVLYYLSFFHSFIHFTDMYIIAVLTEIVETL